MGAAIEELRARLDTQLRVELTDGRSLIGNFTCFDKQKNILLSCTCERQPGATDTRDRNIGLVLVPWRWITDIEFVD